MAILMHGLDVGKNEHASLQMQFFWKYIQRLKSKGKLSFGGYGDTDTNPKGNMNLDAAKSDAGEVGAQSRLSFHQTMTFFNALTELEAVLRDLVFEFISKQRMHKREHIDFSNIAKHLGQAVYLDNDVIMFERMPANQMLLKTGEQDIVGMAAFVLRAIYRELLFWGESDKNWKLPHDATPLIEDFEDKFHISHNAKLFADWGWNTTSDGLSSSAQLREQLKGVLADIDEQTPFKSPDYEDYYDALHGVLFDGDCSLESLMPAYHQAWEELCVFHLVGSQNPKPVVVWCDYHNLSFYVKITEDFKQDDFKDFRENWSGCNDQSGGAEIIKRPDLILKFDNKYIVYDFKHYSEQDRQSLINFNGQSTGEKLKCDLKSLNFYASCVERKSNPYGNNSIPRPEKRLCFPVTGNEQCNNPNTNYFDYDCLNTEELMTAYLKYPFKHSV